MAFKIFNKEIDSNIDALKDKIPSVGKLAGLFGKKQDGEIEKKEPEVPVAGGMEETANIFNMDYQEQKAAIDAPEISLGEPGTDSVNVDVFQPNLGGEAVSPSTENAVPELAAEKADDSVYDEFNFDLTLPKDNSFGEPVAEAAEEQPEMPSGDFAMAGTAGSQAETAGDIDAILDAPAEELPVWKDDMAADEASAVNETFAEPIDLGSEVSFTDNVADELERLDEDPKLAILEENNFESDTQTPVFNGENLDETSAEEALNLDFNQETEPLAEVLGTESEFGIEENNAEAEPYFESTENVFNQPAEDSVVAEEAVERQEPFMENEAEPASFEGAFADQTIAASPFENNLNQVEADGLPIIDDVVNDVSGWNEGTAVDEFMAPAETASEVQPEGEIVAAPIADERSGVYQEPVIRRDVEAPVDSGYWNDAVNPFIKWYSGTASEKYFEVSRTSEPSVIQGTDDCHSIHVNAGYNTYGWVVEFSNGKVMNLSDIKEFQLRKGYLPDTAGRICYGDLTVSFSGIDKITVYESVQYFSYGM